MSLWRCLNNELVRLGGGPLRLRQFYLDSSANYLSEASRLCLVLGVMEITHLNPRRFSSTSLGIGLAEGRYQAHRGSQGWSIKPVIRADVGDDVINRLLLQINMTPGEPLSPASLRLYSNALAAEVRHSAAVTTPPDGRQSPGPLGPPIRPIPQTPVDAGWQQSPAHQDYERRTVNGMTQVRKKGVP